MCTSIVHNGTKTIVGWNLDILDMDYRVEATDHGVYIEILTKTEGWLPLFGANARGDFVAMPTCWPYDKRSDPEDEHSVNIIKLNMNLLLCNSTFEEIKELGKKFGYFKRFGCHLSITAFQTKKGMCCRSFQGRDINFMKRLNIRL